MADNDDDFNLDTDLENPVQLINMITSVHKNQPYDEAVVGSYDYEEEDDEEGRNTILAGFVPRNPSKDDPIISMVNMLRDGRELRTERMLSSCQGDEDKEEYSDYAEDEDDENEEDAGAEETGGKVASLRKVICVENCDDLPVSKEIKDLFRYIDGFQPQEFSLDLYLKPFIPNYIAAVSDVDAMIKVPRPDGKPDLLGMTVIDEPAAKQTDPAVFKLALKMEQKSITGETQEEIVKSIEHDPKEIDEWVNSLVALHRIHPPPKIHYTRNMPSIDSLMQEWMPEIEEQLQQISLPTADLDCELPDFVDIVCSLLDIPIYKSRIESLHLLFSLYSEFNNSQHFSSTHRTFPDKSYTK